MNTLEFYNLSVEMRSLLADLEESGGELTPEAEARLDALGADLEARVGEMALACREMDRTASAIEQERDRLSARARSKRAMIQALRDYITDHMAQTGTPRVRTDLVTVSLVPGAEKFLWEGKDEHIPEAYRRTLVEYVLDQELAKRHRAEGVELPEGIRVRRKNGIRIL